MEEQIFGPVNGFYIACYTTQIDQTGRYASYAKVCSTLPETYWDACCLWKVFGGEHHLGPAEAMASAAGRALAQVRRLDPSESTVSRFTARRKAEREINFSEDGPTYPGLDILIV